MIVCTNSRFLTWETFGIAMRSLYTRWDPKVNQELLTYILLTPATNAHIVQPYVVTLKKNMFIVISHATAFDALDADRFFLPQTLSPNSGDWLIEIWRSCNVLHHANSKSRHSYWRCGAKLPAWINHGTTRSLDLTSFSNHPVVAATLVMEHMNRKTRNL